MEPKPVATTAAGTAPELHAALVDSRQRYKHLVEASCDFAWETDAAGQFVFVSSAGALGYTAAELLGRRADQLLAEDGEDDRASPFRVERKIENTDLWLRRADGDLACVEVSSVPLIAEGGRNVGARGVCRDVTEDRARQRELAEIRERERVMGFILRLISEELESAEMLAAAARATARSVDADGCRIVRHLDDGEAADGTFVEFGVLPSGDQAPKNESAAAGDLWEWSNDGGCGLFVATAFQQAVNGAVMLWRPAPATPWDVQEKAIVTGIARHIGIALAQIASREHLERLARTDPMTGLLNRRAFFAELERRTAHARRTGRAGTLAYVDLDNFKAVNDGRGHAVGDDAIRAAADILVKNSRTNDLPARLGGDEFAVWLEETDGQGATAKAEALLTSSRTLRAFSGAPDRPLTLSIGMAVFDPATGETMDCLMERADAAMYRVKQDGKSGFHIASEMEGETVA